jgi:hypothetical protein
MMELSIKFLHCDLCGKIIAPDGNNENKYHQAYFPSSPKNTGHLCIDCHPIIDNAARKAMEYISNKMLPNSVLYYEPAYKGNVIEWIKHCLQTEWIGKKAGGA